MNEVLRLATTPRTVIPVDVETTAMLAAELRRLHAENEALKAALTPRKPLTDEEIGKIAGDTLDPWSCARAIEKAHGIGEQHE